MEVTRIERRDTTQYGIRNFSWQGIVSGILLIAQVILLVTAVYLSYLAQGDGSLIVGILGITAAGLSLTAIAFAIWGGTVKDHSHGTCLIGGCGSAMVLLSIILISTVL